MKDQNESTSRTSRLVDIHLVLHTTIDQNPGLLLLPQSLLPMNPIGRLALLRHHRHSLFPLAQFLANKMLPLRNHLAILLALAVPSQLPSQPTLGKHPLATLPNFLHPLHGLHCRRDEISVVFDGHVALLGELGKDERRVHDHFFAARGAVALRPLQFPGLALHLEVLVAFGPAEAELSGIVPDECYPLPWEGGPGTEMTGFHTVIWVLGYV